MVVNLQEFINIINIKYSSGKFINEISKINSEITNNIEKSDVIVTMGKISSSVDITVFENAVKEIANNTEIDFKSYINQLMFEKNITFTEMCKKSHHNKSTLSRYLNGERKIPINNLFRMIFSLRLNLEESISLMKKNGNIFDDGAIRDVVVITALEECIYDVTIVEELIRKLSDYEESLFGKNELKAYDIKNENFKSKNSQRKK